MIRLIVSLIILIGFTGACKDTSSVFDVSVSGRQILVKGQPYIVKGICYHPVPKGSSKRSFESLTQDLAESEERERAKK